MIESFEIQNFRGFRHIALDSLSRINIVVGDNGAGKTALLEALFMAAAANPEVALRYRQWRGVDSQAFMGSPQELYDGVFLDLFNDFNKEKVPHIFLKGTNNDSKSLTFYYDEGEPTLFPFNDASQSKTLAYTPITFEWKDSAEKISKVTPELRPNGIVIQPVSLQKTEASFLAARVSIPTSQNAKWFSDLSKRGVEKKFISTVRAQFSEIESMSVEVDMGAPVIFIKYPWLDKKMPIYLASDGLNKLVTLLLHIAHSEHTAFFVDEVENGFHFSRHDRLWEQMYSFSKSYDTQLFLTTHSLEYLQAAVPLMEKHPKDFSMIQVHRDKGESSISIAKGAQAALAIKAGIEVRK